MSRVLCLVWLHAEAVEGPRHHAAFAREVAGAIANDSDDVSLDALRWLDRLAQPGSRWARQAQGCIDELDRIGRRDTIPAPPPSCVEASHGA
jgi:hypothetical protein